MSSSTTAESGIDKRKVTVSFDCQMAGCAVQFKWTEVSNYGEAQGPRTHLEGISCSGIGRPGCPVTTQAADHDGWRQCPRMQRLMLRLRGWKQHTSAG